MAGCYAIFHKQLGDLVLLEPALARLRDYHGEPVELITRTGHAPLVGLMRGVKFVSGAALTPHRDLYCFDPLSKSALRSLLAPVWRRVCVLPERREMRWYHSLLFRPVIVTELGDEYVAEYFWRNVPVPTDRRFRPPQLQEPPADWRPGNFSEEPFVLLNPTSGWRKKTWTAEGWAAVVADISQSTGCRVVMTSGSTEWQVEHCREIVAQAGGTVKSLASGTTLEQFLWLCSRARAVLTVDGAASHLAAAFGVKNLTLFGPTNRNNWHRASALSVAVQAEASKDGVARMKNLRIEDVVSSVGRLLG